MTNFKYFNNPAKYSVHSKKPCQFCGENEGNLEGVYFEKGDNIQSICLKCLKEGKETVYIPSYIQERLEQNLNENNTLSEHDIRKKVISYIDELSKTPPVPWIQFNDWPVCCADFAEYIGEWDREEIIKNSKDKGGKKFLLEILDEFSKNKIDDFNFFWNDIGINTAIFVFKCISCNKFLAIAQSY